MKILPHDPAPTAAAPAVPASAPLGRKSGAPGRRMPARPSAPMPGAAPIPWPVAPALLAGGPSPADGPAAALRAGLARGEIGVHYQPVVRLADRRPVMVEALARWNGPGSPVSPDTFVPLAERNGLGRCLSVSVAGTAAADMGRHWPRLRLGVSINLPLAQLLQPDLQSWLRRALGRRGLGPRQVALELTETTPVLDLAELHRALLRLRRAGYRVLLDDVALGDGRTRLHRLPFSGLKLDRSMVERLPFEAHGRQEVRRLVQAAEARGQAVIAEGVSDGRIWAALCDLGVHYAQGFAVSRPLPAAALPGWWAGWRGGRVQ
ncbi:EAL domain-containing protein [Dankookia sp. P2]|uniref:EAL domain-containing protein n=1 Tax=Dankookia sp. P2 TaxID=3423955 RepID=UPI003D67D26E